MAHRVKYRWISQDGYIHLGFRDGRIVAEHRHVWECAHGPIPGGYQIHHRDGDRTNNKIRNLEALLPQDHKREHCGHWTDQDGRWWKRCTTCRRPAPEDDFPTKRYRDGVRLTRGNCKTCERDRQRAKNGYQGCFEKNLGLHFGPRSAGRIP
ncbi:HNH endonuclease signature motif containing protein [uncultured Roseovarius sp.]|uniref:HNH endonuclease signature motif containing protein n=1 Tax=uncultured Roseovarius sp. TaxID=293344 RepID=UPI00343DD670